jgi:hypothetical protein
LQAFYKKTKQMRYFTISLLIVCMAAISFQTTAQTVEANMVFENEKHDFGTFEEVKGKVEHKFIFTNMGETPITITNVKSSCGCTTPSWTKEPIPPGGKGYINAVFNPKNRPGKFHKTITVSSNATNSPVTLHINGNVIGKPVDIMESKYKYTKGPIRMDKSNMHFPDIYIDEVKTEMIKVYNESEEDVTITFNEKQYKPKHLLIKCIPETLKPKEEGKIYITFSAPLKNDYGYVYDRVFISFNHVNDSRNRMTVSAVIKERFTQEMLDNPPIMTMLNDKTYDFGTIQEGDKVEYTFKFKNTGKNDLIIRKTKASCGCTAIEPKDKVIKPGQESSITVIFNSRGKRGKQHKSVTVTTNIPDTQSDPRRSQVILLLKGFVNSSKTFDNK